MIGLFSAALVISAILVLSFKDLLSATIALASFSLILSLFFYYLQAPDVAIAEAAVGAGLATAIFVAAIRRTSRWER